ncbi:MAG: hypothetical protein KDA87_09470 [Planctomycetales bacterium]|nr:hypothetical protein [Planctomycetales bacterium]
MLVCENGKNPSPQENPRTPSKNQFTAAVIPFSAADFSIATGRIRWIAIALMNDIKTKAHALALDSMGIASQMQEVSSRREQISSLLPARSRR